MGVSGSARPGNSCVLGEDSQVDATCKANVGLVEGSSGDEATGTGTGTFLAEARVTDLLSFHSQMVIVFSSAGEDDEDCAQSPSLTISMGHYRRSHSERAGLGFA